MTRLFLLDSYRLTPYAALPLASAILIISIGVWLLRKERYSPVAASFHAMAWLIGGWLASFAAIYASRQGIVALIWAHIAYLFIAFLPAAGFQLALDAGRVPSRLARRAVPLLWIVSSVIAIVAVGSDAAVTRIERFWWGPYPISGWLGSVCFVFLLATVVVSGILILLARARASSPRWQQRLDLLLAACSIGGLALSDFLPSYDVPLYPFGYIAAAGFVGLTFRAIRVYRPLDALFEYSAEQMLESMEGAVLALDVQGAIRVANPAACRMLGYKGDELIGKKMGVIVESPLNVGNASDTLIRGGTIRDRAMLWRRRNGNLLEVAVSGSVLRDRKGATGGIVYTAIDISDRKRADQIQYQAHHDALTGLPNRLLLKNRLNLQIENSASGDSTVAVLLLDLDGFKLINETFDHSAGDELLQAVARRLRRSIRETDSLSRLGGDEFAILMRIRSAQDAVAAAEKILQMISSPFVIRDEELYISTSIGIAIYPGDGEDAEALLKNADNAMYHAKDHGKNGYQFAGPALTGRSHERLYFESSLRRALDSGQFILHYQPVVEIATLRIVGVEALIRWNHPDRGLVFPNDFIGIAEECGLIVSIGEWALREASRQVREWQTLGVEPLRMAINLSATQFHQRDLPDRIRAIVEETDIPPGSLQIEITETIAMQHAGHSVQVINELKQMGLKIAIDDFGTGYSSLSYLKRFPIDTVKLDQSFIAGMSTLSGDIAIVSAVIAMARALDLKVVAEGVETAGQLHHLQIQGCDEAQGYFLSKPLPPAEFERLIGLVRPDASTRKKRSKFHLDLRILHLDTNCEQDVEADSRNLEQPLPAHRNGRIKID